MNCISKIILVMVPLTIAALALPVVTAHAQIATYMVGIMDRTVYEGETARVVWLAPRDRAEAQGWVGVYEAGAPDRRAIEWQYIHSTNEFGYMRFTIERSGDYEVRMFSNSYERIAVASGFIRVRPDAGPSSFSDQYRISVAERSVSIHEPLQIEWRIPWQHNNVRHWVGVFERRAADRDFGEWMYINPSNRTSGIAELSVRTPGTYDVRLFRGSGYERVATYSSAVTVRSADPVTSGNFRLSFDRSTASSGDTVRVSWTAPAGRGARDWIGLYALGATDRSYTSWVYVGGGGSGTATFTAPRAGTYEARFFLDNGYTKVGESSNRLQVR